MSRKGGVGGCFKAIIGCGCLFVMLMVVLGIGLIASGPELTKLIEKGVEKAHQTVQRRPAYLEAVARGFAPSAMHI